MNKVRTIVIDGVEIQTSLSAVEIASLPIKYAELQQENKALNQKYLNAVADYEEQKFNVEQLKKQKEELRIWLEEQIEFVSNITTFTKEIELSHKQQISIYRYILDKIEELDLEGVSNEN